MSDVVVKLYVSKSYKYKWSVTLRKLINWKSNKSAGSPKYLPERCRTSIPAVTTNFYRNAVPARKYLPDRRSGAFRHHYTTGDDDEMFLIRCFNVTPKTREEHSAQRFVLLKLTTDRHEASRGLFATAELLVLMTYWNRDYLSIYYKHDAPSSLLLRFSCRSRHAKDVSSQGQETPCIRHFPFYCCIYTRYPNSRKVAPQADCHHQLRCLLHSLHTAFVCLSACERSRSNTGPNIKIRWNYYCWLSAYKIIARTRDKLASESTAGSRVVASPNVLRRTYVHVTCTTANC